MAAPPSRPLRSWPSARERGSLLIVAMLLSAVIAVSLGSYLALGRNALTLANRSFYYNGALNIAETGIEEALWSFNQATAGVALATAWQGWDISDGITAKRRFTNFTLSGNVTAYVKVYVTLYNPTASETPVVVAQSTVTLPDGSVTLSKTLEIQLRRRSRFSMGLVAKNQITFNGNNASVDSWSSDPDNDNGSVTAAVPYSAGVRTDRGSVGSTSVAVGSVSLNNADIWGFASVGGSSSGLTVGNNGSVKGSTTPVGTNVDTTRVATDFTANFDTITAPGTGTTLASMGATLGTAGATTTYRYGGTIDRDLTVSGTITLILTALPGTNAISLTGPRGITLAANSSLIIYTAANVNIAGNGLLNSSSSPVTFQLWATGTGVQTIELAGNGALKGIVYAPNANVKINGNGDVMGSIVANNITVTGNAAFHYDEALANWGGTNPYGIIKWRELLLAADRTIYTTALASF